MPAAVKEGVHGAGPPGGGQGATPPEAEAFLVFNMVNYACFKGEIKGFERETDFLK